MTNYGYAESKGWAGLIISSAQSSGPSGDIIRLIGSKGGGSDDPRMTIEHVPGGYGVAVVDGVYVVKVTFTDCIITNATIAGNAVTSFNSILTWLRDKHKTGGSAFYVWVYNIKKDDYVKIGYDKGAETDYLKCFLDKNGLQWETSKGDNYYFKKLTFVGVS